MKWNLDILKQGIRFLKLVRYLPDFLIDREVIWYKKCKIAALLFLIIFYFVMPIDFVVDFLFLGLGYVEDIFIALFLLSYVCDELQLYVEQKNLKNMRRKGSHFENKKDCDIIDVDFVTKEHDIN